MVMTFRSSISQTFKIIAQDTDGTHRIATATQIPGDHRRWNIQLTHPSGRIWKGDFTGPNVLDGLGELMASKDTEYKQERGRGHRTAPQLHDNSVSLPDDGRETPLYGTVTITRGR